MIVMVTALSRPQLQARRFCRLARGFELEILLLANES